MFSITLTDKNQLKPVLKKISKIDSIITLWMKSGQPDSIMQQSFEKNFSSEGRPERWIGLASKTISNRSAAGIFSSKILQRTGNLADEVTSMKGAFKPIPSGGSMEWGINQLRGDNKTKFYAHQKGKGRPGQNLPKRHTIGFQKQDGKTLTRSLMQFIIKNFK